VSGDAPHGWVALADEIAALLGADDPEPHQGRDAGFSAAGRTELFACKISYLYP
jgi:hypothetical protein